MLDRDDNPMDPIPGAPADSLVGLGGHDGFVGQCERERCLSAPPPPPPAPEPKAAVTRSYPPIPIPSLPEMPLRARMLRPWMGAAAGAVLIAIVGLASGSDEAEPEARATATEGSETQAALSFGAISSEAAKTALEAGQAAAAKRAEVAAQASEDGKADDAEAEDADAEDDAETDAARDVASSGSSASKPAKTKKKKAAGAFNRDAASSAIFAAASRASGCRTKNGPKGRGRATVTIGPNGGVTSISVSPPFAGTKSGHCVASVFRSVRIAPFSGSPVTLGKSFTVR